jgi:HSP20 family molecular chaperone IbpA
VAKTDIQLRETDTIVEEIDRLHQAISRRAHEFFRNKTNGSPLVDWLTAERELVWKPAVELRTKDGQFEILAAVAGVEPKDLDVQVTPEDVLIKANVDHEHTVEEGTVRMCEFVSGNLFRSVHLPEKIDPNSVKAEYRNGMLRLTAAIAKAAAPRNVEVKAA